MDEVKQEDSVQGETASVQDKEQKESNIQDEEQQTGSVQHGEQKSSSVQDEEQKGSGVQDKVEIHSHQQQQQQRDSLQEEGSSIEKEVFKVPSMVLGRKAKSEPESEPKHGHSAVDSAASAAADLESEATTTAGGDDTSSKETSSKDTSKALPGAVPIPPLPYTEPHWSASPPKPYILTVIKQGTVVEELPLSEKPFHVFGRLPCCDVQLEHPSVSRYHAVLQYRPRSEKVSDEENGGTTTTTLDYVTSQSVSTNPKEEGFYVFDLGSTHGTFLNKTKIKTRLFYRVRVGQMVKFGGSSRLFLLEVSYSFPQLYSLLTLTLHFDLAL